MSNPLEFILKLTDQFSPALNAAKGVSDSVCTRIANDINKANQSSRQMAASVNELRARLEAVNQVRFGTRIAGEFNAATRQARELEKQIERMENRGQQSGGSMVGSFVKGNIIANGIQRAVDIAKEFTVGSYDKALENKSLSNAINTTTKGQGSATMAQTRAIADKYGINYEASLEGVKTLTGGLMSMNMPLKEQMKIFEGVSTGVAAMGLTAEQSKGALLALGQMASKGTVSAEELRGQLGERIPGAFSLAAKAMNVTEAQLGKMMQAGDIAAKDFLPRLAAEMQKTYGADALKNANGPKAIAERFNNSIYDLRTTIGTGLMPIITPMQEIFANLATSALPMVKTLLSDVANFLSGINVSGGTWSVWMDIIKQYGLIVWNGVSRIAVTVWNIISGLAQWAAKSQLIQDIFWGVGKVAEGIFYVVGKIGDAIQWIWEHIIKPILNAVELVYSKVKGLIGSKTELQVIQTVKTVGGSTNAFQTAGSPFGTLKSLPTANPVTLNESNSTSGRTDTGAIVKSKAKSINEGGQRSIVINIGKQIEKLEVHVMDAKEGVNEIEAMVRDAMRRVMYSVNGVVS
jgi:tape measure domain-containing protein